MAKRFDAKKEVLAYVRSKFIGVVATIDPDGLPQAATVFFWANDIKGTGFNLYFVTRRHSRKFENLLSNKHVAFVIGTEFEPMTVQCVGEAELVDAGDVAMEIGELKERMPQQPTLARMYAGAFLPRNPFTLIKGADYAVFRVRPQWMRWMRYDAKAKEIKFHDIIL